MNIYSYMFKTRLQAGSWECTCSRRGSMLLPGVWWKLGQLGGKGWGRTQPPRRRELLTKLKFHNHNCWFDPQENKSYGVKKPFALILYLPANVHHIVNSTFDEMYVLNLRWSILLPERAWQFVSTCTSMLRIFVTMYKYAWCVLWMFSDCLLI